MDQRYKDLFMKVLETRLKHVFQLINLTQVLLIRNSWMKDFTHLAVCGYLYVNVTKLLVGEGHVFQNCA